MFKIGVQLPYVMLGAQQKESQRVPYNGETRSLCGLRVC